MITHFVNDSPTAEWIAAMREQETKDSWTPAQPRYKRVVSLDFISGCADEPAKEAA